MKNSSTNLNKFIAVSICAIVIIFGLFIMVVPIVSYMTPISDSGARLFMLLLLLLVIIIMLLLPSAIHCIVTMKTKAVEYAIIPAVFLLIAEYYYFHDFSTWIASDPNAAIGLVIVPFYILFVLGVSYGITFIYLIIRKHARRRFFT